MFTRGGAMSAVCPKKSVFSRLLFLLFLQDSCCTALEIVLLHTNDVHARVEETSVHSGTCGSESSACFAGVARRATEVARVRGTERHVLLLDAGDQFQGTVWFNHYKGAEAAHFMNKLKYDAMILCPIVSANLKTDPSIAATFGKSYLPYKILTVAGEQVGIVGYVSQETSALSKPGPLLLFEAEIPALQLQVDKLRTLGVNKIIALGHSGFTMDQEIARKVRGVDVVIEDTATLSSTPSDDGRQVPVVQAYAFGKYLGYLKVKFNEAGDLLKATGTPSCWTAALANFSSQVVGQTQIYNNIRFSDGLQWNHVSACIFNGGGDLISVLPFGGTFDLVQLKGSTLFKAFEHSMRRYGQSTGEFLQPQHPLHPVPSASVRGGGAAGGLQGGAAFVPRRGGDGFSMFPEEILKHDSGDLDISVLSDYIGQKQRVYPSVEGRIKIFNSAPGQTPLVSLVSLLSLLWTLCGDTLG
ncbi:hypothetical protein F7725_020034 [Dissostichus mawsoni]|uniref:5'-nucleotidase n=1 Tax=Dissostichus mawsoni TaxID=36200 RepID=A0A7J5YLI5_DISMA|nr:hypothetical protein F7725_020034 [Dissostichus mawsoni]